MCYEARDYCSYKDMEDEIYYGRSFRGNSVTAFNVKNLYVIKSYDTVIAVCSGSRRALNTYKYSMTTSRLQNIIRRVWDDLDVEQYANETDLLNAFPEFNR